MTRTCSTISKDIRDSIIESNLGLVVHIANKFIPYTVLDFEDLVSIGTIGLINAVDTFDSKNGVKFSSYAGKCIWNSIYTFLRKEKRRAYREFSIDIPVYRTHNGDSLLDIIPNTDIDPYFIVEEQNMLDKLEKAVDYIYGIERQVICLRYGLDGHSPRTQTETSRLLGIHQSYVSRLENRTLIKLRKIIDNV